jgi:SH3-like domain-containing protein
VAQIQPPQIQAVQVPAAQIQTNAVITSGVNFRSEPAGTADVISTLPGGLEVESVQESGNWVLIRFANQDGSGMGQEGWVFNTFLESTLLANTVADTGAVASIAESNAPADAPAIAPAMAPGADEQ